MLDDIPHGVLGAKYTEYVMNIMENYGGLVVLINQDGSYRIHKDCNVQVKMYVFK